MKQRLLISMGSIVRQTLPPARRVARALAAATHKSPRINLLLARAAAPLVSLYQIGISPHKGFRCAHATVTGGPSCSQVAYDALRTGSLSTALDRVDHQLALCRHAYLTLHSDLIDQALAHLQHLTDSAEYGMYACGGKEPGPCDPTPPPPPPP